MSNCYYCGEQSNEILTMRKAIKPQGQMHRWERTGDTCCMECYEKGEQTSFDEWARNEQH